MNYLASKRVYCFLLVFAHSVGCFSQPPPVATTTETKPQPLGAPSEQYVPRDPISVSSVERNRTRELRLEQFIAALKSGDPSKKGFCISAMFEYPWGNSSKTSEQWFSPVTYDGEVFRARFKHHFDEDGGKVGDEAVILKEHVTDWSYLDGDQVVSPFANQKSLKQLESPRLERAGTRTLVIGDSHQAVPWYRIDAPPGALRSPVFWALVPCPEGTAWAEVGRQATLEWHEYFEDSRDTLVSEGIGFDCSVHGIAVVSAGEGAASLVHWKFLYTAEEENLDLFQSKAEYVFCFDKPAEIQGRNLGGSPATDIRAERTKLVGIVEIVESQDAN